MEGYTAKSIKVLAGLAAVRKRPGMYIGATDEAGMHHLVWEIVDNAVDEFLAGYGHHVAVVIKPHNYITIQDHGRGIPTGQHDTGRVTPEVVFTTLHAGGKFGGQAYRTSGGLHGVGASVVNALAANLTVKIKRAGVISCMSFYAGGRVKQALHVTGATRQTGTTVSFQPDPQIFGELAFNFELIRIRLERSACLNAGLTFSLKDERCRPERVVQYVYKDGLQALIERLNAGKQPITPVVRLQATLKGIRCEVAMQVSDEFGGNTLSFANNIETTTGGSHEVGFGQGCLKTINQFYRQYAYLKPKDKNFELREIREGLTAIIAVYVPETLIQFEGQTKTKLGTAVARSVVEQIVSRGLSFWLSEHRPAAEAWLAKIKLTRQIRLASKKLRTAASNNHLKLAVNSKLVPARSHNPTDSELFLVEGESAGSTAKQGRNSQFQAVLALRGKFLNAERASLSDVISNAEIKNMIRAIGGGWGADFSLKQVKYHKIIIMTDADTDGAHIQALLLTFFHRFMQPLLTAGYVYLAVPPLYRVQLTAGGAAIYVCSQAQFDRLVAGQTPFRVQRFKGLGEMNAEQLWTTTMDPERRQLLRVAASTQSQQLQQIQTIMGKQIQRRRLWIEHNVDFN